MGNSMSDREKKESDFGEELYEIVKKNYPEHCDSITGILLELDYEELERLLAASDRTELEKRVEHAALSLPATSQRGGNEESDSLNSTCPKLHQQQGGSSQHMQELDKLEELTPGSKDKNIYDPSECEILPHDIPRHKDNHEEKLAFGEKLYSLIEKHHPDDVDKITGILLEIDRQNLEELVENPDCLDRKVKEVLAVIGSSCEKPQNSLTESGCNNKTVLGEQLYGLVNELNPDQAEEITGMLLELELNDLKMLLKDHLALEEKVAQASEVLNGPDQPQDNNGTSTSSPLRLKQDDRTAHIGEQLYHLISQWYPDEVDRITGMLLELDLPTLDLLLKDPAALKEKADQAANALGKESNGKEIHGEHFIIDEEHKLDDVLDSEPSHDLGIRLYDIIVQWHPAEAEKLTGMLMDLDCDSLTSLVQDHGLLKEKVEIALDALNKTAPSMATTNHPSEDTNTLVLGEQLYEKLEETHPENADKITGMLLELSVEDIQKLLNDPQRLQDKIQLAEKALLSQQT